MTLRIFWKKDEIEAVAREVLRLYGYEKKLPVGWTTAMMKAQRVLPSNRHRTTNSFGGPSALKLFLPVLEELRLKGPPPVEQTVPAAPAPAPAPAALEREVEIMHDLGENFELTLPPPEPPTLAEQSNLIKDALSTFIADVLVDSVRKLLTNGEIARMLQSLQLGQMPLVVKEEKPPEKVEKAPPHNPAPFVQEVRPKQKAILICGLKPPQQQTFNQTFRDLARIKFWYADRPNEGLGVLREKAAGVDVVLFTMEATSHSAVEAVQKLGKRFIRVTGGYTALAVALNNVLAEGVTP